MLGKVGFCGQRWSGAGAYIVPEHGADRRRDRVEFGNDRVLTVAVVLLFDDG